MNRYVLFVLFSSGCFGFDRIEQVDGATGDASVGIPDGAVPPDLAPSTCIGLANHVWHIASSTSLNDFTSVIADGRLPASTVWAATATAEVVQLQGGSQVNSFNAASLFSYNTVVQVALDPMGGVVLAAADANGDMQPLLMSMTGTLTTTMKLSEKTTWAGVAVTGATGTSPGSVLAATQSGSAVPGAAQDLLDSFARPHGAISTVQLNNQSPRHVVTTPAGVVACGTNGLFATWTGTDWSTSPIPNPRNNCVYLASAKLPKGYRLAYVDGPTGNVCVSDDQLASVTCTPTAATTFAVAIAPCDPDTLIALSPHTVIFSTDGGKSWVPQGMGSSTLTATDLTITDSGVLYVVGAGGAYAFYE